MRVLVLVAVLLCGGCASDGWTRTDTVAEIAWQALNVVDATQTANIRSTPGVREADPLSRAIIGEQPHPSDAYQLMATYAISHYIISRSLPPKWRKWWHVGTVVPKSVVVINNERLGL